MRDADAHQLGGCRAVEVRTTKPRRALKRAVLVEDDTFLHESGPGQKVGKTGRAMAVFGKVQHGG